MIRQSNSSGLIPTLAFTLLTGAAVFGGIAAADEPTSPAASPGNDASVRHHNPAWAACKKQADDRKLERGDARREFMKGCLKSAHDSAPPAS